MKHTGVHIIILTLLTFFASPAYSRFKVADYNYAKAKEVIKERLECGILEPVEGIWKSSNGKIYVIERFEDERFPENIRYRVIQLKGKNAEPGMVDYFLELTNYDEYYRIWGRNPFTLTNEPVGRECYMTFSPDSFFFKQQLDTVVFTREYPRIDALPAQKYSAGSGFAITPDGYIVTNHHVIQAATNIYIYGVNGLFDRYYHARIVASDSINDIAILKIEDTTFTTFGPIPYVCVATTPSKESSAWPSVTPKSVLWESIPKPQPVSSVPRPIATTHRAARLRPLSNMAVVEARYLTKTETF